MFDNVILDSSLSVNGWKPSRIPNTTITTTKNFSEARFSRSPWPRKSYDIPFENLSQSDREYLTGFYDGRVGPTRSFLLWDRDENHVTAQQIGVGNGAQTVFQFGVTVGDSTNNSFKPLLHPAATGTAIPPELQNGGPSTTSWTVTVGGVPKVEGTDFTVNSLTGAFTFAVPPPNTDAVVVGGWYLTCVRFDGPQLDVELDSIWGRVQTKLLECFNE